MKTRTILLTLCTVLIAGVVSNAGSAVPGTLHYKVKMQSSFGNMGRREVWLKDGMMRCEIVTARMPLTIVKNRQGVFLIHAWNKVAGKYPEGSPRGNPRALLPGPTGTPKVFLRAVNAVKQTSQKVGKQNCDVYSYTEPTTKRFCKLWVDTSSGKPVKLWLKGKRAKVDDVTVTYVSFEQGAKVSSSLFELPSGYAVRPMPKRDLASKPLTRQPNGAKSGIVPGI
jgi:outer membrane lipoprotein-sorting protein